ncbi:MAG: hypothetical protein ACSLFC_13265 [Desulfuromonadales bacterium]
MSGDTLTSWIAAVPRGARTHGETSQAPKFITWILSLVLFLVAIFAHFGIIHVSADISTWSWIIGYALLLVAVQVKGL